MQKVVDAYRQLLPQILEISCQRVVDSNSPVYRHYPLPVLRAAMTRVFQAVGDDLTNDGQPKFIPVMMARLGNQRLQEGALISHLLAGMGIGYEVVTEVMAAHFHDDPAAWGWWDRARARISYAGALALADAYMSARTAEARQQEEEIFRLSAPLLPLYPGILVLPLIGRLDAARASLVTMTMLSAVVAHASRVVLIDLTGLPSMDVAVAQRLHTASTALQLIGAVPVLVGLSPAVAKLAVDSGIDLAKTETRGNLGDGLQYALGLLGKSIVSSAPRRK